MPDIKVYLLGKFDIVVDGRSAAGILAASKKGRLMLQYFLLRKEEVVASSDLYEVLWPEETSTNPESALKTLISRLRASLTRFDETLGKCIVTLRGAYRWNGDLPVTVDLFEFEDLCRELSHATALTPAVLSRFERALGLYAGDLDADGGGDGWFVSRSAYYHTLYLRTVSLCIRLMKESDDHEGIVRVCRRALDVDAFDETLHLTLMESLMRLNRSNEALAQYRHATNLHYNYLGMQPPEKIQNFYKQIIRADQSLGMDIDSIRKALKEPSAAAGAFVCEYVIFKDIYQLLMRNFSRLHTGMFLAIVMLSSPTDGAVDPLVLDSAMRKLLSSMVTSLRKGDTITRYSPSQFALLLPSVNYETGRMVMDRIKAAFYSRCPDSTLTLSYKLAPVEEA